MRHSCSYRDFSEFYSCIFAVSLFYAHFRVGQKNPQSPLQQSFADIKKTYAIDCLNEQFILRRFFHMEVTTRFELVNEGFADLCLTTWPRHHMSRNYFLLFFWSGRRGSNSLPPPWQGGALPDELRPLKMVPPIGIEPMTRGFSVPCSTD